jgi:hypothetical protein
VLLAYCLLSLALLAREISLFPLVDEAGYGDSYILYDVLNYQKTGTIYRDLSKPPFLPAQYSPLVYIVYSLPGRLGIFHNPFEGPRLLVLASFFVCVGLVVSIVNVLVPVRFAWAWAMLLVFSISMWSWVLQIRGDFPGIGLSLLSIRFLLARSRWAVPVAGLCAGLATQFKVTFVAAAAAGVLWLLIRKRWRELLAFAVPAAIGSVVPYLIYRFHEPRMLRQMLALSPGIPDVRGGLTLAAQAASDPVVLLALFGLPVVVRRFWPRWALVIIFATTAFAIAGLTGIQAGGSDNYFFESLFALVPLAVLGVLRLTALAPRNPVASLFVVSVFAICFLAPRALLFHARIVSNPVTLATRNVEFRQLEQVLQGHRIFSTVPRLALLDPEPPLVDPALLFYLQRLGKIDATPLFTGVRRGSYDVVVTDAFSWNHRGLLMIGPELRDSITAAYRPHCTHGGAPSAGKSKGGEKKGGSGWLFHLPVAPTIASNALTDGLARIGCQPVSAAIAAGW